MRVKTRTLCAALIMSMIAVAALAGPPQTVDYSAAGAPPRFYSETHGEWATVDDGTATISEQTVANGGGRVVDTYHVSAAFTATGDDSGNEYTGRYDLTEISTSGSRGARVYTFNERVTLTCQDGVADRDHTLERVTVNANGDVVVNF